MNNLTLGIVISLQLWMTPMPRYSYGAAVWYAPAVMEANCQYRADMAGVTYDEWMGEAIDGVALMSPADMGKTVWIRRAGLPWEGPFRVCDSGTHGQVWEMVTVRGEVVEVGWDTASRWGLGPFDGGWKTPVEVYVGSVKPKVGLDFMAPVDYVEWMRESE